MSMQLRDLAMVRIHFAILTIVSVLLSEQVAVTQVAEVAAAAASAASDTAADDFYRIDQVQSVYLQIAEKDLQRLQAALPERISVPASFRWREITLDKVSVRYKGNSSSGPNQKHKRSFLVKFNEYDKDQRFLDLRRAAFDNGVQFGSLFSEPIITEILRDQQVKTHRCNYARLFLNDAYYGVYVNVERIDESFIEHHLPDANGLLFKVDEGGPGGNFQFLGDDPKVYSRAFEPETKSAKKQQRRLVELIRLVNQTPASELAAKLDATLEMDDFLRVTAVMLLSGAFDQLTGWNPHNYYLYYDGKHDRWRYLPWDLDVGFTEVAFGKIRVLADWNAAWPVAGQLPNPLLQRIVDDPVLLQRYRDTARTILEKYFEPERLCAVIDARYALLKDDLTSDPFPHRRITNPGDHDYDDIVESMKKFMRARYTSARKQLHDPGERPEPVRRPGGPPPEFVEKVQRLQRATRDMQRSGKDMSQMLKLMQQIGPLIEQGKTEEAEKLVVEALKLADDSAGDDQK